MASKNEAKVIFTAETSGFNSAIKSANSEISSLKAEMKLADATFQNTGDSVEYLQQKHDLLEQALKANQEKQEALTGKIEAATKCFGEDSDEVQKLEKQLTNAKIEEQNLTSQLNSTNAQLDNQADSADDAADAADDLSDAVDDAGDSADDTDGKFTTWKATLANLASDAITKVIDACVDLGKEIVELGVDTETAFAKLETIAGTENIDALTESISELSVQTGISSAELADVAYNAISAGASADTAMDMVTAATKLGVAGFTDTSDALSVLSTVMNSYGDSCGTVEEVSDSLIMVQNLGVTTIDELSSSMGKAIATGSAYNVSLGNLESAYVSLTKSGISTEESTTYLNSMLNELGDTGSDVSTILQEKTGKSFSELMTDGYSLSDVLGILYEDCGEDSTALMNLWSSAEAGKASNAIVNQGLEEFNENLEAITDSSGATETAYATMADTTGTKIEQMKQGFASLGLQIYDGLEEPLNSGIDFVIGSVIPGLSDLITNVGNAGSAAIEFGTQLAGDVSDGVSTLSNKITEDIVPTLGDFAETASEKLGDISGWFSEHLGSAYDTASEKLSGVKSFFTDNLGSSDTTVTQKLASIKSSFSTKMSSAYSTVNTKLSGIKGFFTSNLSSSDSTATSKLTSIKSSFSTKLSSAYSTASTKLSGIKGFFTKNMSSSDTTVTDKLKSIKSSFSTKLSTAYTTSKTKLSGIKGFFKNNLTSSDTTVSGKLSSIKSSFSTKLGTAYTTVSTKMGDIYNKIRDKMEDAKTKVSNVVESIKGFFNFTFSWPSIPLPHFSIKPSGWTISDLLQGSIPTLGISWYAEGGVLDGATIFGMLGGNMLGGGEAGPEAVAPIDVLQDYVATAVESVIGNSIEDLADAIIALASRPTQVNLNGRTLATAAAGAMDTALGTRQSLTARGLSLS
ncbi:MAG: phage tail tape measure protein [Lachnospiraceae bacterium]|nr:phage tail tape measure protein [Lachnospiraceae bacterium]